MRGLQQAFSRSRTWGRVMRIYCQENGIAPKHRAVIYEVMRELVEQLSDNQIRALCWELLGCTDLEQGEKDNLLHLLYRY